MGGKKKHLNELQNSGRELQESHVTERSTHFRKSNFSIDYTYLKCSQNRVLHANPAMLILVAFKPGTTFSPMSQNLMQCNMQPKNEANHLGLQLQENKNKRPQQFISKSVSL